MFYNLSHLGASSADNHAKVKMFKTFPCFIKAVGLLTIIYESPFCMQTITKLSRSMYNFVGKNWSSQFPGRVWQQASLYTVCAGIKILSITTAYMPVNNGLKHNYLRFLKKEWRSKIIKLTLTLYCTKLVNILCTLHNSIFYWCGGKLSSEPPPWLKKMLTCFVRKTIYKQV